MEDKWLVIAVAVFLLGMVLYGHYKGFIRLSVSMAALILSLVIVNMAMPKVGSFLKDNSYIHQMVESGLRQLAEPDENLEVQNPSQQRLYIEELNLPEQIKEALIANNNNEMYHLLGVDRFMDYIVSYLSERIIQTIGFCILFVIVLVLIHVLMRWLDLVARLPILSGINKIAGAVLGGIQGLVIIWILCIILPMFATTQLGLNLMDQIGKSQMLSSLYHYNLLSILFRNIIAGVL